VHDLERVDPKSQLLCKTGLCLYVDIERENSLYDTRR
jgi:hypothetical protein